MAFESYYQNGVNSGEVLASFEKVKPYLNGIVLDIGCGAGNMLAYLPKGAQGVDISAANVEVCRKKDLIAKKADANRRLPFNSGIFDSILASHIMEHLESPYRFLKECNRLLKPGGILVLGLPSEASMQRVLKDDYYMDHPGHLYGFSLKGCRELLNITDFQLLHTFLDFAGTNRFPIIRLLWKFPPVLAFWISNVYWQVAHKK